MKRNERRNESASPGHQVPGGIVSQPTARGNIKVRSLDEDRVEVGARSLNENGGAGKGPAAGKGCVKVAI